MSRNVKSPGPGYWSAYSFMLLSSETKSVIAFGTRNRSVEKDRLELKVYPSDLENIQDDFQTKYSPLAKSYEIFLSERKRELKLIHASYAETSVEGFLGLNELCIHLTIIDIDIPLEKLFKSEKVRRLRSLDLSRLNITDEHILFLSQSENLRQLRWLDLSGNSEITQSGVEYICTGFLEGRIKDLEWLDLLGTQCDATPYLDGLRWRISTLAKKLAQRFGFQKWMMLGSREPENEYSEIVSEECYPQSRFH